MTAVIAALASLAIWVFARRITRPLQALAQAADHFGRGEASEPLVVEGPRDIQVSADAFNRMQDRLSRLLETQRTMLRAVGHDLRTPLTSLRIRADSVPEAYGRDQMITVLDDMSVMTEEILRWARDAAGEEAPSTVDLGALVESLTDDYHAQGLAVSFHAPESRIVIRCRRVALRRSLRNVIDNALKYGDCADIRMITHDEAVTIRVEDTGPGIPEARLEDVYKPFVRLESSRSRETGGIGLGLAITRSAVESQGGTCRLANRKAGGLRADITLPLPI